MSRVNHTDNNLVAQQPYETPLEACYAQSCGSKYGSNQHIGADSGKSDFNPVPHLLAYDATMRQYGILSNLPMLFCPPNPAIYADFTNSRDLPISHGPEVMWSMGQ